ncbi:HNH endonuclease [Pseudomonas sp. Lb2C1-1]|uniref:HNH endonuclease n=1 Tax=Pseudomonas TaxID=286 RepID=UPI0009A3C557|nr:MULTISPECIES: HNH endonuclease [Pseudomonas]OPG72286.1 hypothetical protein B1219_19335 [Pseudomonas ogarae]OPG81305.1 hypothetical protein B1218_00445 [Pseudomonas ogarae]PBJ03499.1 hypothetical protein BSF43_45680 [Pseudomonas ogarae]PBJ22046.1 hypothetical protein BSG18_27740 [Pseudomonas ogarae]QXH92337.1 HNH endonuclease [Pseudomonas zarinae]
MDYHIFNIGSPYINEWWSELRQRGVITAGYFGDPGDRGDVILHDMAEGDWLIAYCNKRGYVGAGIVSDIGSYVLYDEDVPGSLSDHRHERGVSWLYTVENIANAVTLDEVSQSAPRQTKERERDVGVAEKIIELLKRRSTATKPAKYWRVLSAVQAIGRPCSIREIQTWLSQHHPDEFNGDARENATLLTVNDVNRRHYDRYRKRFRTDGGHAMDALFREGSRRNVTYQLYRPVVHGIWDIEREVGGRFRVVQIESTDFEQALAEAHKQVTDEALNPIESEEDERRRQQGAIVIREGQGVFKAALLSAYDRRCAMTGCAVVEILEAAHIKPYLGAHTNRTDNGLLLRADIHTLFDKGLIWIDEQLHIQTSERLQGSEYAFLKGKPLRVPTDASEGPHPDHLTAHRKVSGR